MPRLFYLLLLSVLVLIMVFLNNPVFGKSITLKLGHVNDKEWPISKGITEFAKMVKKQSDGLCSVKIYPAGQLGAVLELFEMVKTGALDLALIPASVLASDVKEIGTMGMPFVFPFTYSSRTPLLSAVYPYLRYPNRQTKSKSTNISIQNIPSEFVNCIGNGITRITRTYRYRSNFTTSKLISVNLLNTLQQ